MDIFRELSVDIEPDRMAAIADLIERSPPEGWTRDRAAEGRVRAARVLKPLVTFCFTRTERGSRPFATVILTQKDAGTFHVSNVIPITKHQLSHGEYNGVVEDFYDRVIKPSTGAEGATVNLTGSRVELEHWMPREVAEMLRAFSACANRGTGSSLPSDRERWNDFVLAAHQAGCRMNAPELRRWLIEIEGWPPEIADLLANEYEYGRELLSFAEARRRSA